MTGCMPSALNFLSFCDDSRSHATATDENDSYDAGNPKHVFVLVLNQAGDHVLTVHVAEDKENCVSSGWYLPRFEYNQSKPYQSSYCIQDLHRLLDPSGQPLSLTVVAELFPKHDDVTGELDNPDGTRRVTLVDMQAEHLEKKLPSCAQWSRLKDVIETARCSVYYLRVHVCIRMFLLPYVAPEAARLEDHRCASRWTYRVVDFLLTTLGELNIESISDVERVPWKSLSELFRVNTSAGWYYLKAPPPSSAEMMSTKRLSELFSDDLPLVVGVSVPLGCFIVKGVSTLSPTTLSWPSTRPARWRPSFMLGSLNTLLARKIARIQWQSVQYLEELKSLGVPEYSPSMLTKNIDTWMSDPVVHREVEERQIFKADEVAVAMRKVCARLSKSKLPLTLIHGDYRLFNVGIRCDVRKDDGWVIFDWESACITHPFAECCVRNSLAQCAEYRKQWQKLATRGEVEVEMKLGVGLGWMTHLAEFCRLKTLGPEENRQRMEFAQASAVSQFVQFMRTVDIEELQLPSGS